MAVVSQEASLRTITWFLFFLLVRSLSDTRIWATPRLLLTIVTVRISPPFFLSNIKTARTSRVRVLPL